MQYMRKINAEMLYVFAAQPMSSNEIKILITIDFLNLHLNANDII